MVLVAYAITLSCSYYTDCSRGVQAAIMGAMFRSEEMVLCQLCDAATNWRWKLRYIEAELNKDSVPIQDNIEELPRAPNPREMIDLEEPPRVPNPHQMIDLEVRLFTGWTRTICYELPRAPNPREMIDLEASLEKTESEILELSHNAINLKSNYLELTELRHVLEKTAAFFTEQEGVNGSDSLTRALIAEEAPTSAQTTSIRGRLGFVAGVVPRERVPAFERMLWRISRGNVFLRQANLEDPLRDPNTGNEIYKTVFVAFFQGEQLKSRVKKVCTGFHASLYPCPNVYSEREEMLAGVKTRLEDLNMVLNQTHDHRQRVLKNVAKEVHPWMVMVRKMKAIYHTLNMFNMDVTKKCLIAECWVPVSDLPGVQKALADGGRASGSSIPSFLNVIETAEPPPTFNRTNKFTRGFQNLIDSYGVATYREINPALYTTISFPFLFAIMFGDAGHGVIMLAFGAYMVLGEKKLSKKKSGSEVSKCFSITIKYSPACAPSVLIMFINMMLFKSTAPPEGCDEFMFEGQSSLQMTFVLIGLLCIPVMLLGMPIYHIVSSKKKAVHASGNGDLSQDLEMSQTTAEPMSSAAEDSEHREELSEVFIHQAIHTIEYVLSTISHTASYLRLWALSLAHARKLTRFTTLVVQFHIRWV
uniref:V-type proton ATPase subunit a n=1 Tax=Timema shepardi TaxID=629360 RepID=A0A7R9ANJ9_TIMSH|nr:unnamed protein product [Timema shepardi]